MLGVRAVAISSTRTSTSTKTIGVWYAVEGALAHLKHACANPIAAVVRPGYYIDTLVPLE